jgi:hypothetical protein
MRVISLRFRSTGIAIRKIAGGEVQARTKRGNMIFSLSSGIPEPVARPEWLDTELEEFIRWAIHNYF